ncbi:15-hydroxyprostaglandin dehydrogenase [Stagonosporopsis vannaccii]|nr:15-hydroxyprostaglandin dehydrogenase [Stagonosporopsis vannaccii]
MAASLPVALVTGGASGIGLATVKRLLALNWNVTVVDRQPIKERDLQAGRDRVLFVRADVSSYNDQSRAFAQTFEKWAQLNLVFANAGILDRADFCAAAEEAKDGIPLPIDTSVVDIDLYGIIWSSYLALHYFRKNNSKAGKLVMTSSTAGIYAISEVPLYAAAKHGVIGLARSLGKRMNEEGEPITVNAIVPGTVPTAILPGAVIDAIPAEYLTPASLIVQAVENIINDDSITGQVIECSGSDIVHRPPPDFVNKACLYTAGGEYRKVAGNNAVMDHGAAKKS